MARPARSVLTTALHRPHVTRHVVLDMPFPCLLFPTLLCLRYCSLRSLIKQSAGRPLSKKRTAVYTGQPAVEGRHGIDGWTRRMLYITTSAVRIGTVAETMIEDQQISPTRASRQWERNQQSLVNGEELLGMRPRQ